MSKWTGIGERVDLDGPGFVPLKSTFNRTTLSKYSEVSCTGPFEMAPSIGDGYDLS